MTESTTPPGRHMKHRFPKVVGVVGGASFLGFGSWAMFGPRSFYERIALFDPYNQHFVQDIGAFQLGLGAVLLLATLAPRLDTLTVALLGTGIGAASHAVSHVIGRDLGGRPASDIPTFVALAVLLVGAGSGNEPRRAPDATEGSSDRDHRSEGGAARISRQRSRRGEAERIARHPT